jgi:hypothetical protein
MEGQFGIVQVLFILIASPIVTYLLKKLPNTNKIAPAINALVAILMCMGWLAWSTGADFGPEMFEKAVLAGFMIAGMGGTLHSLLRKAGAVE